MKKIFLLVGTLIIFYANQVKSQTIEEVEHKAPTLQIGLDGILFKRGDLDAQVIIQMIAEAQRKVALKAVQTMFLTKLKESGGATYSFADNIIKNLIEEKDTDIRTRKIFENTVNIAFTYAFLNYYIESLQKRGKNDLFGVMYSCYDKTTLLPPFSLKKLKGQNTNASNKYFFNDDRNKLIATLMDMASLAIRNNEKLKDLGLMQVSYSATYEHANLYNQLKISKNVSKWEASQRVYEDMNDCLSKLTNMIGWIKFMITEQSFRKDQINIIAGLSTVSGVNLTTISTSLATKINNLSITYNELIANVTSPIGDTQLQTDLTILLEDISLLKKAQRIIAYLSTQNMTNDTISQERKQQIQAGYSILSDIMYTVSYEIIPRLKKLAYRNTRLTTIIEELRTDVSGVATYMEQNIPGAKEILIRITPLIQLIARLYEFDQSTTFSEYTKILTDIETIFPNDFANETLSILNTFIKDHVQFVKNEQGKDVIDFKVESFLQKLSAIKPYKFSPFQFHMTVGANSGFFRNPIQVDGNSINNFSYIGEKIGLKIKLYDTHFWKTRNPGETYRMLGVNYIKKSPPKEPMISNIHFLAYGSGILYNIINTSSTNQFNGSLIGAGFGLTFTQILDVNFSYCLPIIKDIGFKQSFDKAYIGLGFDVQFGAYLDRISQKRSEKKIQQTTMKLLQK